MNKRNYLYNLLKLCTQEQCDLHNCMYPDGLSKKDIQSATSRVEHTLKHTSSMVQSLRKNREEFVQYKHATQTEMSDLHTQVLSLQKEIKRLNRKHNNKIMTCNSYTQERLRLLDALESGGVDNWVGYDESIERYNENHD